VRLAKGDSTNQPPPPAQLDLYVAGGFFLDGAASQPAVSIALRRLPARPETVPSQSAFAPIFARFVASP